MINHFLVLLSHVHSAPCYLRLSDGGSALAVASNDERLRGGARARNGGGGLEADRAQRGGCLAQRTTTQRER